MKKWFLSAIVLVAVAVLSSCSSPKDIAYFQNAEEVDLSNTDVQYDIKIMPKDNLMILVTTSDPDAAKPFNKSSQGSNSTAYSQMGANGSMGSVYTYMVDDDGTINFPVLGRIKVEGLSRLECENLITEKLKPYMAVTENPIVTVRFTSFRVTVVGEVGGPGIKVAAQEKMTIVDAIAMSGDLTIYGKRDNIMLIREDASGRKSVHRLNINDPNIIKSPYFYLQQNDIVYVEPNSVKKTSASIGTSTSLWFSLASVLISTATLIVNIVK